MSERTEEPYFRFGEGKISGWTSVTLGSLSVLGVLCFQFPDFLTTPQLRQAYTVDQMRWLLAGGMVFAAAFGVVTFALNRHKLMGAVGITLTLLALWGGVRDVDGLSRLAGARGGPGPEASAWGADPQRLRMIAIPTTLSAAEFFPSAGVTDVQRHVKQMYTHPLAVPKAVILDPAATLETPLELLLSTGIRAVDHAIEGWCSVKSAPMADAANREAMRLLASSLPEIRTEKENLEHRALAQHGMWLSRIATMAGIPYGASHGIGYLLGGGRGVPHGITSCVTLPAVMAWNEPVNAARQADVSAAFVGEGEPAAVALRRFIERLGLPTRLREVGIAREDLPTIAASWDGSGPIATNPRKVRGKDDLLEILEQAW